MRRDRSVNIEYSARGARVDQLTSVDSYALYVKGLRHQPPKPTGGVSAFTVMFRTFIFGRGAWGDLSCP